MTWYCIRTAPGAQQPQREYRFVSKLSPINPNWNGRGKPHRLVRSLNPNVSAIERELTTNGFKFYMPCEYEAIRDRKKTNAWRTRRKAILTGYVFVADVKDFGLLESLPGVIGTVGSITGKKYELSAVDFIYLRTKEANSLYEAEQTIALWERQAEGQKRKTNAKKMQRLKKGFKVGARVSVLWGKAIGRQATVVGWTEDAQIKAIADGLDALPVTLATGDVKLIAA